MFKERQVVGYVRVKGLVGNESADYSPSGSVLVTDLLVAFCERSYALRMQFACK